MDRGTKAVAIFASLALAGLSLSIGYIAVEGLLTRKVHLLGRFSPGLYETGVSGFLTAISYFIFAVGLAFAATAVLSTKKGDIFMFWFKRIVITSGIVLVGALVAHFYVR